MQLLARIQEEEIDTNNRSWCENLLGSCQNDGQKPRERLREDQAYGIR